MKIIFLDIDGVLVTFRNKMEVYKTYKDDSHSPELDHNLMGNLVHIIEQTGAKIVLSSSWRRKRLPELHLEFYKYYQYTGFNISHHIKGFTPSELGHGRGNEILQWMVTDGIENPEYSRITHWCVIDDTRDTMKPIINLGLLVNTRLQDGLTIEKSNEAISLLNK